MVELNIAGPRQRPGRELLRRAHVDELDRRGRGFQEVAQLAPVNDLLESREDVAGDIADDVDRVFRGAEWRRISGSSPVKSLNCKPPLRSPWRYVDALVAPSAPTACAPRIFPSSPKTSFNVSGLAPG